MKYLDLIVCSLICHVKRPPLPYVYFLNFKLSYPYSKKSGRQV